MGLCADVIYGWSLRLQLLESDLVCGGGVGGTGHRRKWISFTVEPGLSSNEFSEAVGWSVGFIAATYVVVGVILAILHRYGSDEGNGYRALGRRESAPSAPSRTDNHENAVVPYGGVQQEDTNASSTLGAALGVGADSESNLRQKYSRGSHDQRRRQSQRQQEANESNEGNNRDNSARSSYSSQIVAAGIFYAIPIYQVARTSIDSASDTDYDDECFYNSLCSHFMFGLNDFNHVFSNVAYVAFGVLLVLIATCKSKDYYCALGVALALEGVTSALYHVCPSGNNLQLDLVFIFVILILLLGGFLESTSEGLSVAMAAAVATALAGMFLDDRTFMTAVFCVAVAVCAPCFSFAMYHRGEWASLKIPGTQMTIPVPTTYKSRAALSSTAVNFLILFMGLACVYSGYFVDDFASLLLAILLKNVAMSTAFVYAEQFKNIAAASAANERFVIGPRLVAALVLLLTGIVFLVAALVLYAVKTFDPTAVSAAASRRLSRDCLVLDFFDHHDLWHFASAFGALAFLLAMMLADEEIAVATQPRTNGGSGIITV